MQGCIRKNPEAFFARKIIVCEGATEIGFCRAINQFRIDSGKESVACKGVRFADGTGNGMSGYVTGFNNLSYPTALLCDSDCKEVNNCKQQFKHAGIEVIDCNEDNSIEQQVFNDAPWNAVKELIQVAINKIEEDGYKTAAEAEAMIFDSTNAFLQNKMVRTKDWYVNESFELRLALGLAAKKKEWYKRQDYGELMGKCILTHYSELANDSRLKSIIDMISSWIDK